MKLSISLPDSLGHEIRTLALHTERDVSWWIRQAWEIARTNLLRGDLEQKLEKKKKALKKLSSLKGSLKRAFPDTSSVALSHRAFHKQK